jgi:hypothetical protein
MSTYRAQDKSKEIAFFDAHDTNDEEYDLFTPQDNAQLINEFVQLSGSLRGSRYRLLIHDCDASDRCSRPRPKANNNSSNAFCLAGSH